MNSVTQNSRFNWQNELQDWTKKSALQQYLQSGLQDSTVGKSALYDAGTEQGQKFRERELAGVEQSLGARPMAGIDPAQATQIAPTQSAAALQQRDAIRQGGFAGAMSNQQSTTDWINQMMGSSSQLVNKNEEDWHNYKQAVMTQGATNAASKNAQTGSYITAGATTAGIVAAAVII